MEAPAILQIEGVSRTFPQDVGESAAAIWREMLLPRRWLAGAGAHGFAALDGIDLTVGPGQCVGVLGAHRSGKSTLAGIAAGVLAPTAGRVVRPRRCVLVARPIAGFKPGLTVRENLRLMGVLHGVADDVLDPLLDATLARLGVSAAQAGSATGNLSPHVVRPLGLALLLSLPADLLVIDGLSAAGIGDARWVMRSLLRERLTVGACLVLSADPLFLNEVAACVHLLERGRLTGPYGPHEAPGLCAPWSPQPALTTDDDVPAVPWQLLGVTVDGQAWCHAQASLLRRPGECLRIVLDLRSACRQWYGGGRFELHGGGSGLPVGRWDGRAPGTLVQAGEHARLCLALRVPDAAEDFCGLSFTPADAHGRYPPDHRLKVLIYGVGQRHARAALPQLDITCLTFETERNASHGTTPESATVPAPPQGQPAARQVG